MVTSKPMGRRGLIIFHSVILLIGVTVQALLCWVLYLDLIPYIWDETGCRIRSCVIQDPVSSHDALYKLLVEYTYEYDGKSYVSDKLTTSYSGDSVYRNVQRQLARYTEGSETTCYVNPEDPSESVLMHHVQWILLPIMTLPLAFIAISLMGFYVLWKQRGRGRAGSSCYGEGGAVPFTKGGKWVGLGFFSFFLIPGILYFHIGFLSPTLHMRSARSWQEIPCTIISSRYVVHMGHSDDPFEEYSLDILYTYRYGEKAYRSNDYDFMGLTSSDLTFIEGILAEYPPGETRSCYVNPKVPEEARLNRDYATVIIFHGLFALVFIAIGAWGYFIIIRGILRTRRR